VLDELAEPQQFAAGAELLLGRVEGGNGRLRMVGAEEVPRVEAGEVLNGSQELITPNWFTPCMSVRRRENRVRGERRGGGRAAARTYLLLQQIGDIEPPSGGRLLRRQPF
jgi:hypothetical protein